jgi:hypothetical protein
MEFITVLMRIARNSGHYDRNRVTADQGGEIGGRNHHGEAAGFLRVDRRTV